MMRSGSRHQPGAGATGQPMVQPLLSSRQSGRSAVAPDTGSPDAPRAGEGQVPGLALVSCPRGRRGSRVKRGFACPLTRHVSPVLVVPRGQARLRLEGRPRTLARRVPRPGARQPPMGVSGGEAATFFWSWRARDGSRPASPGIRANHCPCPGIAGRGLSHPPGVTPHHGRSRRAQPKTGACGQLGSRTADRMAVPLEPFH